MAKVLVYGFGNYNDLFPGCDITELDDGNIPEKIDDDYEIVYLGHILQRYPRDQVGTIIKQFAEYLKPYGEMWVVVPSLEWAARELYTQDHPGMIPYVMVYGNSFDPHLSGFTLNWLRVAMQVNGLIVRKAVQEWVHIKEGDNEMKVMQNLCIAYKPKQETDEVIT